jgi:type VI protein secretion system component Hcp
MPEDLPDVYLRFDGFVGECNDQNHKGEEGWITIKSFSFGFGFPGRDGASETDDDEDDSTAQQGAHGNGAQGQGKGQGRGATAPHEKKKKRKRKKGSMKSGPMTFDRISFSKSSDSTSHKLMEWCHQGKEIREVNLHACRYGGEGKDVKMVFLDLTFENVYLKSCKLNLATDNLPTEDIEFEYEKVYMKCIWTDNATGARLTSTPISVGWDLDIQKALDVEPDTSAAID